MKTIATGFGMILSVLVWGSAQAAPSDATASAPKASASAPAMKRHSHVEAKGGMVSDKMPESDASKPYAGKDQSKHFHPRDGK
ncbi:hypothetical protein [Uliginosibacterium gangwonense]|uniref:hypothetical protein n=1 Tax=Uliginosibacterium gangwonense TaxID=392736 RepID=UPI00036B3E6A|nr:hypothetical protein [Uliginosibacterium gangwonense]